nr:hypothetical protein HmN_000960500 [Hymenolepis microstoma]
MPFFRSSTVYVPDDVRDGTTTTWVSAVAAIAVLILVLLVGQATDHRLAKVPSIVDGWWVTPRSTTKPVPGCTTDVQLVVMPVTTSNPSGPKTPSTSRTSESLPDTSSALTETTSAPASPSAPYDLAI